MPPPTVSLLPQRRGCNASDPLSCDLQHRQCECGPVWGTYTGVGEKAAAQTVLVDLDVDVAKPGRCGRQLRKRQDLGNRAVVARLAGCNGKHRPGIAP